MRWPVMVLEAAGLEDADHLVGQDLGLKPVGFGLDHLGRVQDGAGRFLGVDDDGVEFVGRSGQVLVADFVRANGGNLALRVVDVRGEIVELLVDLKVDGADVTLHCAHYAGHHLGHLVDRDPVAARGLQIPQPSIEIAVGSVHDGLLIPVTSKSPIGPIKNRRER